jgi:hypothetical protein
LILSYALLVWHVGAFAVFFSPVRYVFYAILAVALLHVPIFAAQCAAAKYAVVMAIIGGMLLSLLSCGLLHSREQARRLSCTNQLRQMGLVLQEQSLLGHKPRLPPPVADQSLPGNGTLKLLSSD